MKGQPASHGHTKTHRKMGATGGGQVSRWGWGEGCGLSIFNHLLPGSREDMAREEDAWTDGGKEGHNSKSPSM